MDTVEALEFVSDNHRAVLCTNRSDGGPQMSPVLAAADGDHVVVSSRETAYKVRNLRRDPRASIVVMTDGFYGKWCQIDGTAEIVSLPDAMDGLVEYYRGVRGEHPDWDEYRAAMRDEQRVLVRITPDVIRPTLSG